MNKAKQLENGKTIKLNMESPKTPSSMPEPEKQPAPIVAIEKQIHDMFNNFIKTYKSPFESKNDGKSPITDKDTRITMSKEKEGEYDSAIPFLQLVENLKKNPKSFKTKIKKIEKSFITMVQAMQQVDQRGIDEET